MPHRTTVMSVVTRPLYYHSVLCLLIAWNRVNRPRFIVTIIIQTDNWAYAIDVSYTLLACRSELALLSNWAPCSIDISPAYAVIEMPVAKWHKHAAINSRLARRRANRSRFWQFLEGRRRLRSTCSMLQYQVT